MGKITPQILVTFISVDKKQGKTIHHQLYEQLKNGIYAGMLRPGDRMPSTRELGKELKVSRNGVLQVFEQLMMEGFLETKTGSGTFVSKNVGKIQRSKKAIAQPTQKHEPISTRPYGLNNPFKVNVIA